MWGFEIPQPGYARFAIMSQQFRTNLQSILEYSLGLSNMENPSSRLISHLHPVAVTASNLTESNPYIRRVYETLNLLRILCATEVLVQRRQPALLSTCPWHHLTLYGQIELAINHQYCKILVKIVFNLLTRNVLYSSFLVDSHHHKLTTFVLWLRGRRQRLGQALITKIV